MNLIDILLGVTYNVNYLETNFLNSEDKINMSKYQWTGKSERGTFKKKYLHIYIYVCVCDRQTDRLTDTVIRVVY